MTTSEFILRANQNGQITGVYFFRFDAWGDRSKALRAASDMSEALFEDGNDVAWFEQ